MTTSENPSSLPKTEVLYELLKSLQCKEICLEVEGRMYRGDLVYVGEPHAFVTIKDVLQGNVGIPFTSIRNLWYRNSILWNNITQRPVFSKRFNKR